MENQWKTAFLKDMTVTVAEMKATSSYCDFVLNEQNCVEAMLFHSELREYHLILQAL